MGVIPKQGCTELGGKYKAKGGDDDDDVILHLLSTNCVLSTVLSDSKYAIRVTAIAIQTPSPTLQRG